MRNEKRGAGTAGEVRSAAGHVGALGWEEVHQPLDGQTPPQPARLHGRPAPGTSVPAPPLQPRLDARPARHTTHDTTHTTHPAQLSRVGAQVANWWWLWGGPGGYVPAVGGVAAGRLDGVAQRVHADGAREGLLHGLAPPPAPRRRRRSSSFVGITGYLRPDFLCC
jgi:hypothetical protein